MTTPQWESRALAVPSSVTDQIAHILEQEIVGGRYRRGTHLQQDEISGRFGVSRTPAREALRKLQAIGLVRLVPNKGALVHVPTLEELREVYDVRAELEGYAAALVAGNRSDALVTSLHAAQQELADLVRSVDPQVLAEPEGSAAGESLISVNDAFHHLIHSGGGNRRLAEMIKDCERYFPRETMRLAIQSPTELQNLYLDEHMEILDEITRGRPDRARAAMVHHIHQAQAVLLGFLRQRGFSD